MSDNPECAANSSDQQEKAADHQEGALPPKAEGSNPSPEEQRQTTPSECERKTVDTFWDFKFSNVAQTILACALVFVGFRQVDIYRGQAVIMAAQEKDSADALNRADTANGIAMKQLRQEQRAWIEFSATNIKELKVVRGKPIQFDIEVLDIGKTAARDVRTFVVIERLAPTQAPSFKVDIGKRNIATIGALFPNDPRGDYSVSWWKTHYGDPAIMTAADVRDWKSGKYYFAVYGMTTYYDIFGGYHWVTFCAGLAGLSYLPTQTRECVETYNSVDDDE
jgi:hypothetical protein